MKNLNTKKGFTLIELLLVVAIMGILAVAILVTISSQKERAEHSKALAELSATIQPIMMCKSDGGEVTTPSANGNICKDKAAYGKWPAASGLTYDSGGLNSASWFVGMNKGSSYSVCCNSLYLKCAEIATTCKADSNLN